MNSETLVKEAIIKDIKNIVSDKQVVTDHETLYDAASDRYRKYMKAKGVLDNPLPTAVVYPNNVEEVKKFIDVLQRERYQCDSAKWSDCD